ncbi:ABC transporter permease [Cupriavidus metallidurans]|uniref:ABC transporter permease n=2 Tax=Burkholderiaceae TaxID=119060 RepID=UPI00190F4BD6|nr:ABC transporter permease [Cupriavidus metallidurans]
MSFHDPGGVESARQGSSRSTTSDTAVVLGIACPVQVSVWQVGCTNFTTQDHGCSVFLLVSPATGGLHFSARSVMTLTIPAPLRVTLTVWRALFLREAVTRVSLERAGSLWILLESAEHIAFLMILHGILQHRLIPGANPPLFIGLGILPYYMFRRIALRGIDAVTSNRALFHYRQVKAFDVVLVRSLLEAFVYFIVSGVLILACWLYGMDVEPTSPLLVMLGFFLLWAFSTGISLILSAGSTIVPEIGQIAKIVSMWLFYISGVMYPIFIVPEPYRSWLLYNPIVHALEIMRIGYFPAYHAYEGISISYLSLISAALVTFGLLLHVRFRRELESR